jgi:Pectate lyase superfamily protein
MGVVVAFARHEVHRTVNVRHHGAKGDGVTDDSAAIRRAAAALGTNSTLYFPSGTYRFADPHPKADAAIAIAGVSRVAVEFAAGAELVMDNLDPATGTGTSHGILVRGPASDVELRNVTIRWLQSATRSMGDGIRIVGDPFALGLHRGPVNRVALSHCSIQGSPQAGVIMVGVSDIRVTGLRSENTRADGLHFNACRRAQIDNYTAIDPGDDGLALVTYYTPGMSFDRAAQTFSFPDLTRWSNDDFVVANVTIDGGEANGVRLAGARRVTLTGLDVARIDSGAAVMVDSAAPGNDVGWHYVASRGVRVSDLAIDSCETGIHVLARPNDNVDRRFTHFDVAIEGATIRNCANWSVRAESLTDQRATGFDLRSCTVEASSSMGGNGGVGLANTKHSRLDAVSIRHSKAVLAFSATDVADLAVDRLAVTITDGDPPDEPGPCTGFENCDGVVDDMQIAWDSAPETWSPLHLADDAAGVGQSAHARLTIRTV